MSDKWLYKKGLSDTQTDEYITLLESELQKLKDEKEKLKDFIENMRKIYPNHLTFDNGMKIIQDKITELENDN